MCVQCFARPTIRLATGILLKGSALKLKQKFVGVSSTGVLGKAPAAVQVLLFFGKSDDQFNTIWII